MFLLPSRIFDSPTPHSREAIPSSQTSTPNMPVPVRPLNSGKYGIWKEKGLGRGGEHIPERAGLPFVSLYSPLFKDTRWPLQWCVWEVGGRLEQESCFYGSLNTRVHSCLISACSLMEGRKRRGHNEWNRCASSMQWMASKKVWGEACFSLNYWDGFHTSPLRQNFIKKTCKSFSIPVLNILWCFNSTFKSMGLFILVSHIFIMQFNDFWFNDNAKRYNNIVLNKIFSLHLEYTNLSNVHF